MSLRGDLFVEPDQSVNGSLSDLQRGKVREKVITNKETHEHPVIYGSLEGGREGGRGREREREENIHVGFSIMCVVRLTHLQVKWKRQTINAKLSLQILQHQKYVYVYTKQMYFHDATHTLNLH